MSMVAGFSYSITTSDHFRPHECSLERERSSTIQQSSWHARHQEVVRTPRPTDFAKTLVRDYRHQKQWERKRRKTGTSVYNLSKVFQTLPYVIECPSNRRFVCPIEDAVWHRQIHREISRSPFAICVLGLGITVQKAMTKIQVDFYLGTDVLRT